MSDIAIENQQISNQNDTDHIRNLINTETEIPKKEININKDSEEKNTIIFPKRRCLLNLKRRCRDKWALFLFFGMYLVSLVGPLAKVCLMDKTPLNKISYFIFPGLFFKSMIIYGCLLIFYVVMTLWFVAELIVFAVLISLSNIAFVAYLIHRYKIHFTLILLPSILMLLFLGYLFFYRKALKVSILTFRCSAAVIKKYFHWIFLLSLAGIVIFAPLYMMMIAVATDVQQNKVNSVLVGIVAIYTSWYMMTFKAFIDCYISSLIYYRLYGVKNVPKMAIKTAVMSLGTCSIIGFVEAVFDILRSFLKQYTNQSSWFNSSLLSIFIKWLLNGAMDLIYVFMDIYHKFVIGFTSLHNTNYLDGAKLTYKNISNFKGYPISNYLTYGILLRSLEFTAISILLVVVFYDFFFAGFISSIVKNANGGLTDIEILVAKGIQIPLAPISGFAIARFIYQKLFSGSMAVLLLYCVDRETLNLQFPDFSMEKEI
ncbi:hypothetical protein EHP00_581 [Ecytonucleospora hepatopenaei]|uniref:Protein PNS1 n=1 Tax=Ecytonucleospora hepatopenaei TaxID=646526 RepID=A0A1W0E8C3_9MICR|nr:hypothetical protein EHP00_581 [Ecytonucleospora hepatopenaei]